jgi:hypothetical protein
MKAFLQKYAVLIAVVIALGTGLTVGLEHGHKNALKESITTLRTAQDSLHIVLAANAVAAKEIEKKTALASESKARADSAQTHARVLDGRVAVLKARLDSTPKDTVVAAEEEELFDVMQAETDSLTVALAARTNEAQQLRESLDIAQKELGDLRRAALKVDTVATKVVSLIRPNILIRLTPKPGFGVALGVDQTGTPRAVVGLILSWPR